MNKSASAPSFRSCLESDSEDEDDFHSLQSHFSDEEEDENWYQLFQVCDDRCFVLDVKIVGGRDITRGKIKDWLYKPDPYVTVQAIGTPNGLKRTRHAENSYEPVWDETLQFYIDPHRDRIIEFVLYDLNLTINEEIGREIFEFHGLQVNLLHNVIISFKNGSKIDVQIKLHKNENPSLRFSLDLSPEETAFRKSRAPIVSNGISSFLDISAPGGAPPTICLMTSGGGFRAMIASCGVYKALEEAGLVDCLTYMSALSGSSWYLSTLYSHPEFGQPATSGSATPADKLLSEIRSCVEKRWQVHLSPPWSSRYLKKIIRKSVCGQPVSFTDFYGYLIGEQILKGRMKARLSNQQTHLEDGKAPMPSYTCLHVKSNVSAKVFQEWYEFTPYEVGIPKYGVFLKTTDFASKFYMGQVVKRFPEIPLHFLYGIWGSAFTILFKRLVTEKGRNGDGEILKMLEEGVKEEEEELIVSCMVKECCIDEEKEEAIEDAFDGFTSDEEFQIAPPTPPGSPNFEMFIDFEATSTPSSSPTEKESLEMETLETRDEELPALDLNGGPGKAFPTKQPRSFTSMIIEKCPKLSKFRKKSENEPLSSNELLQIPCGNEEKLPSTPSDSLTAVLEEQSRWDRILEKALTSGPLDSRAFRAGVILNPMRGLTVTTVTDHVNNHHVSPVKPSDVNGCDFKGYRESMKTDDKKIYLVDSGLSFNLPFPLMLRPQREIQLYITFDFSSRKSDSTPPFRELLLAEKWARLHNMKFPPVKEIVKGLLDCPIRECYVFKDPLRRDVPVIIFFPLVNDSFRYFKAPGVPRETDDEKLFGQFSLFDSTNAFAIWRFFYPNLSFDRLTALVQYNVMNNLGVIREEIRDIMKRNSN